MLLFKPCTVFFSVFFWNYRLLFCLPNFAAIIFLIQTSYSFSHENNYPSRNGSIVGNYYRTRITKKNKKKGWLTGRICSLSIAEGFLQMRSDPNPIYKRNKNGIVMEHLGLVCIWGVIDGHNLESLLIIFLVCLLYLKIKMLLFKPMLSAQDGAWNL